MLLNHPVVTAGLAISGLFELGPLLEAKHINDNLDVQVKEIEELSPMRMQSSLSCSKPLSIAYGTKELPAFIENSRKFHEKRAGSHLPGHLIPVIEANHFTVLDGLRSPNSHLTRALLHLGAGCPGDDSGPGNGAGVSQQRTKLGCIDCRGNQQCARCEAESAAPQRALANLHSGREGDASSSTSSKSDSSNSDSNSSESSEDESESSEDSMTVIPKVARFE